MFIEIDKTGSIHEFEQKLNALVRNEQIRSCLILACDENGFTPDSGG